ncbi:hypothetical protein HETIRDRAFT_331498 [Heterobasidion irregulare TC 32-1]|uniref:DUF659 domain-containing protein n=1 Tax=Heterobasidion irregulare (strain TC 32-1) TaxID=747525 RepID=W4JNK9_HETIT|nr:uncharacterized protein HETIRDRAFT_331498 [Heterobasidion irregulare TC 32-1]ETW75128.1 hypothetical protein HETIRDRAFT_331498 [Heterobasidion irregulare TC 32-1]
MLHLVCAAGLAPSIVDYNEWKEMIGIANPRIKTISLTTLSDILIPHKASFVQQETIKELKLSDNLTISYDGGTTRLKELIYTFHATTSDPRKAYLLEGNEASGESHTAKHIAAILERLVKSIGPEKFSAAYSDSTGNTKLACELLHGLFPWIIPLADPCHHFNNTIKDICKLEIFNMVIKQICDIITFFSNSDYGTCHLRIRQVQHIIL